MASVPQMDRSETYDILRNAQNDWGQVSSLLHGVAKREQSSTAVILTHTVDEAGSGALHYAAVKGLRGMLLCTPNAFSCLIVSEENVTDR